MVQLSKCEQHRFNHQPPSLREHQMSIQCRLGVPLQEPRKVNDFLSYLFVAPYE